MLLGFLAVPPPSLPPLPQQLPVQPPHVHLDACHVHQQRREGGVAGPVGGHRLPELAVVAGGVQQAPPQRHVAAPQQRKDGGAVTLQVRDAVGGVVDGGAELQQGRVQGGELLAGCGGELPGSGRGDDGTQGDAGRLTRGD